MITMEEYASVYLSMVTATGNAAQQQAICAGRNFSPADWAQAQAFYTAKMMEPGDAGRTATAFAMLMANPQPAKTQASASADFVAVDLKIDVTEFDVQMITFAGKGRHLTFQRGLEFDETAESFNGNTFHISLDSQDHSIYGGLKSATLGRDRLTLVFDDEGRARMGVPQVTVNFTCDEKKWAYLARKLKFVLNPVLEVQSFPASQHVVVGDVAFNQERVSAKVDDMQIRIRPHLSNVKATGRYETLVNLKFDGIFDDAEAALVDEFEHDLGAVFAFDTTTNGKRTFFVYSRLDEGDFMTRINLALRGLPRLPLEIGGGSDSAWENYAACLADVKV